MGCQTPFAFLGFRPSESGHRRDAVPASDIWLALASFVLFRLFDILKPLGIRTLDRRKGAFYVMADDILAGVYSLIIIVAVQWII